MKNVEKILKNRLLVKETDPAFSAVKKRKSIRILYGETYDLLGMTIDSLKYYFFTSLIHKYFEISGIKVTSIILVGDRATLMNDSSAEKDKLIIEGQKRIKLIKKIIQIYKLPIKPLLMSEMLKENKIPTLVGTVEKYVNTSDKAKKFLEKTVLKNKIKQETKSNFQYSKEEIAIGTLFDIKIGPPREKNYDEVTRMIQKNNNINQLISIYLQPSYPLGKDFPFFINHPEIEEFGLTPYKSGSNRLQENRIVIGQTNFEHSKRLIENSFLSKNPLLPNPVLDIYLISKMAEFFLNSKSEMTEINLIDVLDLKKETCKSLHENIYKPLNLK
jgi:hypothetical protein